MSGTQAGAGPREWDPGSIQTEGGRVDPWNPEAGGRPVFTRPETGAPARGGPEEQTRPRPGGGRGPGAPQVAEQH